MDRRAVDQRVAQVAARQHSVFSREQVDAAGGSQELARGRVRSGAWDRLARDVFRIPGSTPTWMQRLWSAHLEAGPRSAVSHRSAAALLGVPGFDPGGMPAITVWRGSHHRCTLGTLHETFWLPECHLTLVDGLPCTSLARTVFDLAGQEHPKRVERALDNSLSRGGLTIGAVAEVVAAIGRRGVPGTTLMRRLLAERSEGYVATESELEALLCEVVAAAGVPAPVRQCHIGGHTLVGRVDFAYRDARLVVECDGRRYHTALLDREADRRRDNELAAAGFRVVRVTWTDLVEQPVRVIALIRQALRPAA